MALVAWLVRAGSMVFSLFPRRRRIALLSRQSSRPLDFVLLEPWLRRAFPDHAVVWCCVRYGGRLGLWTMVRQLWLQATSSLCIVDGYVPAVCIPRADVDDGFSHVHFASSADGDSASGTGAGSVRSLTSMLAEAIGKVLNSEDAGDYEDDEESDEFAQSVAFNAAVASRNSTLRTVSASWRSLWRGKRLAPCVQLWHAMGAIKCFGYQALDTAEGRSSHMARTLAMHRGYTAVVAGARGAVPAFAQAFDCPASRVWVLGSPRVDYLAGAGCATLRDRAAVNTAHRLHLEQPVRRSADGSVDGKSVGAAGAETGVKAAHGPVVLYAPTYRKHPMNPDWHRLYVQALRRALPDSATLVVSGHPLDGFDDDEPVVPPGPSAAGLANEFPEPPEPSGEPPLDSTDAAAQHSGAQVRFLRSVQSIHALVLADYVVTDYSAIAFEAMLARRKVLFYVPDISPYRNSPGLNVDPERELPSLTFREAEQLGDYVACDMASGVYDHAALAEFERRYGVDEARDLAGGSCARIARLAADLLDDMTAQERLAVGNLPDGDEETSWPGTSRTGMPGNGAVCRTVQEVECRGA